jgi:histidine triad (HIT) family protein
MEKDCIFCQIIQGEKPGDFVFQDDSVVAFKDRNPQAPVHILILPKKHIRSINDLSEDDRPVISDMFLRAKEIAAEMNISQSGYKLVFNVEKGGGQYVFHLHLHLIGGWKKQES